MNITYKKMGLSDKEEKEIERLLSQQLHFEYDLQKMWLLLDKIWDEIGCDNKKLNKEKLNEFYSHPVWLLNGLFIESDPLSKKHRQGMAKAVKGDSPRVLDWGGGFGSLAKEIASSCPVAEIEIFDPYASSFAYKNIGNYKNIGIIKELRDKKYDYIFTTDVLEHIEDPISLICAINSYLKPKGTLVAAWNFTPCIKCHLPRHFHFRYTMHRWILPSLGFRKVGDAVGGHGYIFEKVSDISKVLKIRTLLLIFLSKILFPFFRALSYMKQFLRNIRG